jgi:hypothetical protein
MTYELKAGDRIVLKCHGIEGADDVAIVLGPSPVWWRAQLSNGQTYDFEVNDVSWSLTRDLS